MMGSISIVTGWAAVTTRSAVVLLLACGCVVVGLTFFDETPDMLTIVGCTLIIAAGVATARHDARSPTPTSPPAVNPRNEA